VALFHFTSGTVPTLSGPASAATADRRRDRSIFGWSIFDYALVVAPFWIGAVYLAAISVFSNSRPFIFFLFLILLGESHFGTTWLFFLVRENRRWVWERRGRLVYLPLVMTGAAYVLIGATNLEAAILIGGLPPVFT
jgi:hypothetical protein